MDIGGERATIVALYSATTPLRSCPWLKFNELECSEDLKQQFLHLKWNFLLYFTRWIIFDSQNERNSKKLLVRGMQRKELFCNEVTTHGQVRPGYHGDISRN